VIAGTRLAVKTKAAVPGPTFYPEELIHWRNQLRANGKRLVFTNGCFDLLHAGHVRYLQQARALGDALLVGLNSDASVRALKGPTRPLNSAADRAEVLGALGCVDAVAIFEGERCADLIRTARPDAYAKGGDYTPNSLHPEEKAALDEAGTAIHILPLVPGRSTSDLIRRATPGPRDSAPAPAPATPPLPRLAVLGSGTGSNFAAIADAITRGGLPAEIVLVLSDIEDAGILRLAHARGLPARHVAPGPHRTRLSPEAEAEYVRQIQAAQADLVILAGFMRVLKAPLLSAFPDRILNIHPSLLPDFKGLAAWEQALAAGVAETGCTVHLVNADIDAGRILMQARVPVLAADTPATLHARIHRAEHALYPAAIHAYWTGLQHAP
jgi:formyltetrahydrofolate-dependent phosphoribosylglycinamide formyltransferase